MECQYAGFWIRVLASLIDTLALMLIVAPVLMATGGAGLFDIKNTMAGPMGLVINYIFPALAIVAFWIYKTATPGKIVTGLTIIDEKSGQPPSPAQCIVRYLGYFVSTVPLCLGLIWVAFDKRKQGWHDKIAGTVVIKKATNKANDIEPESQQG